MIKHTKKILFIMLAFTINSSFSQLSKPECRPAEVESLGNDPQISVWATSANIAKEKTKCSETAVLTPEERKKLKDDEDARAKLEVANEMKDQEAYDKMAFDDKQAKLDADKKAIANDSTKTRKQKADETALIKKEKVKLNKAEIKTKTDGRQIVVDESDQLNDSITDDAKGAQHMQTGIAAENARKAEAKRLADLTEGNGAGSASGSEADSKSGSGNGFLSSVKDGYDAVADSEVGGAVLDFTKDLAGEIIADKVTEATHKIVDKKKWIAENCEEKPWAKLCKPANVSANVPEMMSMICEIETYKLDTTCVDWRFKNTDDKSTFYAEVCLTEKAKGLPQCDQDKMMADSPEAFKENFCKEGLWHKNEKCRNIYRETEPDVYAEEYCIKRKGLTTDSANCSLELIKSVDEDKYSALCYQNWEGTTPPEGCNPSDLKDADAETFLSKICKEKDGISVMPEYCSPEFILENDEDYFNTKYCEGGVKHSLCEIEDEEEEEEADEYSDDDDLDDDDDDDLDDDDEDDDDDDDSDDDDSDDDDDDDDDDDSDDDDDEDW